VAEVLVPWLSLDRGTDPSWTSPHDEHILLRNNWDLSLAIGQFW
jgi:hypothetical protein